jgi:hypothetical protein
MASFLKIHCVVRAAKCLHCQTLLDFITLDFIKVVRWVICAGN